MEMFVLGFLSCMIFDIVYSFISYVVEKSLYYRDLRKNERGV